MPEQHFATALRSAGRDIVQTVLTVVCLPYEAFFSLDAIVRTIWRMLVTRTRLLEWSPSNNPDRDRRTDLVAYCRTMWIGPVLAIAAVVYLMLSDPSALDVAAAHSGPLVRLPAIAWWISRPLTRRAAELTTDQTIFLRKLARKTWAFFETVRRFGRSLAATG